MVRVARRAVVLTSLEALAPDRLRRVLSHLAIDVRRPHVERNFFLIDEFRALLGHDLRHEALLCYDRSPVNPFWPRERIDAIFDGDPRPRHAGARAGPRRGDGAARAGDHGDHPRPRRTRRAGRAGPSRGGPALARWLVNEVASLEYYTFAELCAHGVLRVRPELEPPGPAPDRPVAPALLARLQCPECRASWCRTPARSAAPAVARASPPTTGCRISIRRGRTTIAPRARRPCAGSAVTTQRARPRSCA